MTSLFKASLLTLFTAFSLTLAPSTGSAGDLNPSHLPSDAKWVLHVNFEALSNSQLAEKLRKEKPKFTEGIHEWFRNEYGIDPPNDLRSVTMFSRDYKRYTGTVILQADYDRSKVLAKMKQAGEMKETQWQDHTLYTVTVAHHRDQVKTRSRDQRTTAVSSQHDHSGGKQMTVALVDDDTVVIGSSVPNAKATLKLLAGEGDALKSSSPLLSGNASNAWLYGAAISLQQIDEHIPAMPVLQQHERITWTFGGQNGRLFEHAVFVGQSEDVAGQTLKVMEGIAAYETLWSEGSQPMKDLMKNTRIARNGNAVEVSWEGDTETVLAALEDIGKRFERLSRLWQSSDHSGL